jgi:acyl-CoA dehydrogenase
MSSGTALSGGVFGAASAGNDDAGELRRLVVDLGRRSLGARRGHRRVPDELDDDLWSRLEDTGLARLGDAVELDGGPAEVAIVLRGLARYAAAVPVAETGLLGAWLGRQAGLDVPDSGPLTVALANAHRQDGRLCGTATNISWPGVVGCLYLVARTTDGLYVTATGSGGVEAGHNLGGEPRGTLEFALPAAQFTEVQAGIGEELILRGAWARCMQTVGALDGAVELTANHTRERIQFGRPLASFQSVQHALASMAATVEQARAAATLAVVAATDHGFGSAEAHYATTVAKVTVGQAVTPVTTIAHQLHGAIGVTMEHPLWRFTMRAKCWMSEFGSTDHNARKLGRVAVATDGTDPWDVLIGNDMQGW